MSVLHSCIHTPVLLKNGQLVSLNISQKFKATHCKFARLYWQMLHSQTFASVFFHFRFWVDYDYNRYWHFSV